MLYSLSLSLSHDCLLLIKATNDPYYLDIGKTVIDNLNKYTRVPCGFATIKDVRGSTHEDRYVNIFIYFHLSIGCFSLLIEWTLLF